MTQRLKTKRPDQEIYVPRHKRGEDVDKPLHIKIVEKDEKKELIDEEKPALSNIETKPKSYKTKASHANVYEEKFSGSKNKSKAHVVTLNASGIDNKQEINMNGNVDGQVTSRMDHEGLSSQWTGNEKEKVINVDASVEKVINVDDSFEKAINVAASVEKAINVDTSVEKVITVDTSIEKAINVATSVEKAINGDASVKKAINVAASVEKALNVESSVEKAIVAASVEKAINVDASVEKAINVDASVETDNDLYSAALHVSEVLSEIILAGVYQSLGKATKKHLAIYNCSERMTTSLLKDSYNSSLGGIRKSKRKLKNASAFSEKVTCATLQDAFKDVNDTKGKIATKYPPSLQVLNKELYMQLMFPEIVTNIINTAIENAMEITQASQKSTKKQCKPLDIFKNKNATSSVLSLNGAYSSGKDSLLDSRERKTENTCSALINKLDNLDINDNVSPIGPSNSEVKVTCLSENLSVSIDRANDSSKVENDSVCKENTTEKSTVMKKKKKMKERVEGSHGSKLIKKKRKKEPPSESTCVHPGKVNAEQDDNKGVNLDPSKALTNDVLPTSDVADDWEMNYSEDGECLNKEIYETSVLDASECSNIENGDVIDYLDFKPKDIVLDIGEFGHVLELYDFSSSLKSSDIYNALKAAGIEDYTLHWVDDSHALAVFASQVAAHNAMKVCTPLIKMRQVVNGTRASRIKIKDLKDVMLPYKKRPQSTSMVARNLVAGALGIRTTATKEQRDKEREMLKKAREEKRLKEKQKRDIWESPDGY